MSDSDAAEAASGSKPREAGGAPGPSFTQSYSPQAALSPPLQVAFDRRELRELFELYGRKVAAGEWRDYALDFLRDRAVFSVYRRTAEFPLYRIEKNPRLARRQGAYSVIAPNGLILKRGHDLGLVLKVLEKPVRLVVG
jgi:hypothetical protein